VLEPDQTVTYTPAPGFNGTDAFGYTVSDGALSASATVTVAVSAVNQPPVATADATTTAEDTPVSVDVLGNDGDPDLDPLTVVSVGTPAHGTAVLEVDRTVTYTPGPNFHGTDGFLYVIRDPGGLTASATVTVTVTPVNDAPVASPDSAATPESTPVTVGVLANDQDVDGDPLQVTAVGTPGHGTAVLEPDQTVTYTPAPGFNGTDAFGYTVSDGALSASATVTVAVAPGNDTPGTGGCGCSGGGASGLSVLLLLAVRRRRGPSAAGARPSCPATNDVARGRPSRSRTSGARNGWRRLRAHHATSTSNPPTAMRFGSKGIAPCMAGPCMRGSFMTFALTRSRCARDR
jgi:hypothetical protein